MLYPCLVKILKRVYLPEVILPSFPCHWLDFQPSHTHSQGSLKQGVYAEGSQWIGKRCWPSRLRLNKELEDWVVRMAKENRSWGYDRIAGALAELGYDISDQTVGNILKRRGLPTAPDRKKTTTWKAFIRR